jgi:general secretion pathway protein K
MTVQKQRGIVLVMVLWVTVLLSVLAASYVISAHTEVLQARNQLNSAQARYAAEAGIQRAVFALRNPDPNQKWIGDGREYAFAFAGAEVKITLDDESGKIDINQVDELTLKNFMTANGVDLKQAEHIAGNVMDWRDPDDLTHQPQGAEKKDYVAAGLAYIPRNANFETVDEIQQVMGMDYELYKKLEPSLTLYSGRNLPNPAYAPEAVLRALPGLPAGFIEDFLQRRRAAKPGDPPIVLPDGTPVVAQGGGMNYTIHSKATLQNGAVASLDATVTTNGSQVAQRPFRVLRWRDSN